MSGGHWNYLQFKLEERAQFAGDIWLLMAQLERELDWGISCDTCIDCARIRVSHALEKFFDEECNSVKTAISVAKDGSQYKCHGCSK